MPSPLDELRKRFGRPRTVVTRERQRPAKIRSDFKGTRKRLHVRLPIELANSLDLLARVRDVSQNDIVEELLRNGTTEALAEVRDRLGESAWEALKRRASERILDAN